MPEHKVSLFGRTRTVEHQIDKFLDLVSEAGLTFEQIMRSYLKKSSIETTESHQEHMQTLEHQADELRRNVERALYTEMLIPESRGDVLRLINDLDELVDMLKHSGQQLLVERPDIPAELHSDMLEMTHSVVQSVEHTVLASRTFFRNPEGVRDHIHKISFFETESDKSALHLKKQVFGSNLPLERKRHLAACVDSVDFVADQAENVGDNLSIYALKRSL